MASRNLRSKLEALRELLFDHRPSREGQLPLFHSPSSLILILVFSQVSLKQCDGKLVTMLEENDFPALHEYTLTYPEHFTLETSEGLKFNSYIIKPPNFDPAKKYPVLVYYISDSPFESLHSLISTCLLGTITVALQSSSL